jgi:membrane-associated phospholipid phosphatase
MVRGRSNYAVAVVACAAALVAEGLVAFGSAGAHSLDARTLKSFTALQSNGHLLAIATTVSNWAPVAGLVLTAVLVAIALRQGRRAIAIAVPVAFGGSVLSAELLKHLVGQPRLSPMFGWDQVSSASWPSGHTTGAMIILLCALLVVGPRLRPLVAVVGGAGVLLVGCSMLVTGAHYPSDVLGGLLLAGLWMSLMLAVLRRGPAVARLRASAAAIPLAALAALVAAAVLALLSLPVDGSLLAATATLALVASALSGGVIAAAA